MTIYVVVLFSTTTMAAFAHGCYTQAATLEIFGTARQDKLACYRLLVFATAVIFFLLSALRYDVGADYGSYESYWLRTVLPDWESGFIILVRLVQIFTNNYEVFIAVNSLIVVVLFCKCYKDYTHFNPLAIYLFFAMGLMFQSFVLLRQAIAMAVIFFSYRYFSNGRWAASVICFVIAILFHSSTIMIFPLVFLSCLYFKKNYYLWVLLFALGLTPFVVYLGKWYVDRRYWGFHNDALDALLPIYSIALGIIVFALALLYRKELLKLDSRNNVLINISFFYLIFTFWLGFIPVLSRCFQFFIPFLTILVPRIVDCEKNVKIKRLYIVAIIAFYAIFMCFFARYTTGGVYPYRTIFSK